MKHLLRYLPVASFTGVVIFAIAEIILRWVRRSAHVTIPWNNCREVNGQLLCETSASLVNTWTPTLIIQLGVTVVFGAGALYAVLSKQYKPADKHWAYSALGLILGFWLGDTVHG